jgi:hypothetical protein
MTCIQPWVPSGRDSCRLRRCEPRSRMPLLCACFLWALAQGRLRVQIFPPLTCRDVVAMTNIVTAVAARAWRL